VRTLHARGEFARGWLCFGLEMRRRRGFLRFHVDGKRRRAAENGVVAPQDSHNRRGTRKLYRGVAGLCRIDWSWWRALSSLDRLGPERSRTGNAIEASGRLPHHLNVRLNGEPIHPKHAVGPRISQMGTDNPVVIVQSVVRVAALSAAPKALPERVKKEAVVGSCS